MQTFLRILARLGLMALAPTVLSYLRKFLVFVLFVAGAAGLLYLVQTVPEKQVARARVSQTAGTSEAKTTAADVAALQNEMRKTFVQMIGGAFALAALYFTYRRTAVAEQGHITDRYSKAIEQLGATRADNQPNIEVRLGGIYALERIALDSARDQRTIMEVLTAYVRQNAPAPIEAPTFAEHIEAGKKGPATDIQAILTAIGRRRRHKIYWDRYRLDLSGTDLRGANLEGGHFENTNFSRACLYGVKCSRARLESSSFRFAYLHAADFGHAYMPLTNFTEANTQSASFFNAHLDAADFTKAHAEEADFSDAFLDAAGFNNAHLDRAEFTDARLRQTRFKRALGLDVRQFEDAKDLDTALFDEDFTNLLRQLMTGDEKQGASPTP